MVVVALGQQYNMSGRDQSLYCTLLTLIALPGHQTQQKQKIKPYMTKKVVIIYAYISIGPSSIRGLGQQYCYPSGNPFKYHVVALSLQPIMLQYIMTTIFDDVLHCFCFVFTFCLVSLHGD